MITYKDILRRIEYPWLLRTNWAGLRVGAAVGVGVEVLDRVSALCKAGCDVLIVDTAHGHSQRVLETVKAIRKHFPEINLIAGNIATAEAILRI